MIESDRKQTSEAPRIRTPEEFAGPVKNPTGGRNKLEPDSLKNRICL